jgi:D-aminoacyl-tRNA deacylase
MKAVIQRVSEANVIIENKINGAIKNGLVVLIGIEESDNIEDIIWLSAKICNMRIFNDANDMMNLSVIDINGEILLISQFTLYASTKKGNRPSFIKAAKPEIAIPIYEKFIMQLQNDLNKNIATGIFGTDMKVQLINDGPVTIVVDSKMKE